MRDGGRTRDVVVHLLWGLVLQVLVSFARRIRSESVLMRFERWMYLVMMRYGQRALWISDDPHDQEEMRQLLAATAALHEQAQERFLDTR